MKRKIKENFWIVIFAAAGLFFLNILLYLVPGHSLEIKEQPAPIMRSLPAPKHVEIDKPSLNLNLRLLGTVIGNPSLAIIFDLDSGKHNLYKVNDDIKGSRVAGIFNSKVVIEKDNTLQELLFESKIENIPQEIIISKSGMMREMNNSNALLSKIKIMPIPDETITSKLKGFRIDNIPAGSIIERAGVRSGDVICFIQGQKLESSLEAMRIFQSVQNQSDIKVDLLRDNRLITLRYKVKRIG